MDCDEDPAGHSTAAVARDSAAVADGNVAGRTKDVVRHGLADAEKTAVVRSRLGRGLAVAVAVDDGGHRSFDD